MCLVSVVIPAYNASKFIGDAFVSIFNQNINDYEIIVVDDGSTDTTKEVIENYQLSNKIRYFYQKNSGPGAARNKGLEVASGDYICFLDADDEFDKESLSKRIEFLKNNPSVDMVFTDFYNRKTRDDQGSIHLKKYKFLDKFSQCIIWSDHSSYVFGDKFLEYAIRYSPFIWTGTVMMRRTLARDVGKFNVKLKVAEDIDYWLRITKDHKVGFIDQPLSYYNNYRSTLTKETDRFYADTIMFWKNIYKTCNLKLNNKILLRKKVASLQFDYGYHLLKNHNIKKSRRMFVDSMAQWPLQIKPIKTTIITCLPHRVLTRIYLK